MSIKGSFAEDQSIADKTLVTHNISKKLTSSALIFDTEND